MKITLTNPDLSLEQPALTERHACDVALLFKAVSGQVQRRVAASVNIGVPNDRDALPISPTVGDVIRLVIRRQHPALQYVAELNGVTVEVYRERYSFVQAMACIVWSV